MILGSEVSMKLLKGFSKISSVYSFHYYKGNAIGLAVIISRTDKCINLGDIIKVPLTTDGLISNGFNPIGAGEYETN